MRLHLSPNKSKKLRNNPGVRVIRKKANRRSSRNASL